MWKLLRFLKNARDVLAAATAVLAAAIVAVETYEALRKRINTAQKPRPEGAEKISPQAEL
jgi:hypothetical protein